MILETTLSAEFVPGSNLKGQVAGANWSFLLPSLELACTLCIGLPSRPTLMTLAQLSKEVYVLADSGRQLRRLVPDGLMNVYTHVLDGQAQLPLPGCSVDLLLITSTRLLQRFYTSGACCQELRRVVKPGASVYAELAGPAGQFIGAEPLTRLLRDLGSTDEMRLWLTPQRGEAHTAMPVADAQTRRFFQRRSPESQSPVIPVRLAIGLARLLGQKSRPGRAARPVTHTNGRSWPGRAWARRAGWAVRATAGRVDRALGQQRLHELIAPRHGILAGRSAAALDHQPPHYLRSIACEAGLSLAGYRWGLAASGEYSSRKVLMFLFAPEPDASGLARRQLSAARPQYVVKLVREPAFNQRIENEHRALLRLREVGVGDQETLPQVAFFGYHAGLAVLGQTAVEGTPFRQRTRATAHCPHARGVIDFLFHLAAATATPAVPAGQVAGTLRALGERFARLYPLAPHEAAFLGEKIDRLAGGGTVPLVFQHGDPGPWNVLVTPGGRIAVLDWEAAELHGLPLWDLFYFLRSYCLGAIRSRSGHDRVGAFAQLLQQASPLSELFVDTVARYCRSLQLPGRLVEPLFYACWMHRALKEATRLRPAELEHGHYVNLLRLCIDRRDSPLLSRLFSLP